MWDSLSTASLMNNKQKLCEMYVNALYNKDIEFCSNSSSLQIYPEISMQCGRPKYLISKLTLRLRRLLAQIRLLNKHNNRICIDYETFKFNDQLYCHRCNRNNNLLHIIIDCENFREKREDLMLPLIENGNLDLFVILEDPDLKNIKKFLSLIKHILYTYKLIIM